MAKNLTPVDAFTLPVTVPENADSGTNRAGDLENSVQTVFNQTHHLNIHSAKKDEANTFTAAPQTVNTSSASTPLITTTADANDHPSSGGNIWKLISRYPNADGTFIRFYVGNGANEWIRTTNAVWDPASGAQTWSQDNSGQASTALWCNNVRLHWFTKPSGSGAWGVNAWADAGELFLGAGTLFSGTIDNSGHIATNTLTVEGSGTAFNVVDDVNIGGSVNITTDLTVGDDIDVGDNYLYSTPKNRSTIIPLTGAFGATFKNFQGSLITTSNVDVYSWTISLPAGATLNTVQIMYGKTNGDDVHLYAVRKHSTNWSTPTVYTSQQLDDELNGSGSGTYAITADFGGLTVNNSEEYEVTVTVGASGDSIHQLRVNWIDPGPRNH